MTPDRHLINRRSVLGAGLAAPIAAGAAGTAGPAQAIEAVEAAKARETGPALSIADFGAEPGSGSDQTRAIQHAIDEAQKQGRPLVIPPGRYRIVSLAISAPLHLMGAGPKAFLEGHGGAAPLRVAAANVRIEGLNLSCDTTQAAIAAEGAANLNVCDCTIANPGGMGIALEWSSGTVSANRVEAAATTGIFANNSTGLAITGNHVGPCGNNGIQVWRSQKGEDGTLIADNRVSHIRANAGGSGQNGNGINIYRADNVTIAHNRVSDCAFSAIRNNAGSNCQVIGNNCSRLGEVAIYCEFDFEGSVVANNIVAGAALGISITNFNDGGRMAVCAGNIVRDLAPRPGHARDRGVGIYAEADTAVTGNIVENAAHFGIMLGWGSYLRGCIAANNCVRGCPVGIAVSDHAEAGTALVTANMIAGASSAGIAATAHDEVTTGDLMVDPSAAPAHLSLMGNVAS